MKPILAIDPGTTCGWCLVDGGGYISGVWKLGQGRTQSPGMRFIRLRNEMKALLELSGYDTLVFEEVKQRPMSVQAGHIYGGFKAMIMVFCEDNKIEFTSIPAGTIKKHATGKGNANKDLMIAAAKEKWPGWEPEDDNEADARWIAATYIEGGA